MLSRRGLRRLAAVVAMATALLSLSVPRGLPAAEEVARDLFTTTAHEVAGLQAAGVGVVCYLRPTVWEPARPDAGRFPEAVLGGPTGTAAGERWLDIRAWDEVSTVLADRLRLCREKGFSAVVFGEPHEWGHDGGADLTPVD